MALKGCPLRELLMQRPCPFVLQGKYESPSHRSQHIIGHLQELAVNPLHIFLFLSVICGTASAGWQYHDDKNEMTDEVSNTYATLENPKPPYGTIIIANRKNSGVDASLAFSFGMVDCGDPGCRVLVRVDDAAPVLFDVRNSVGQLYLENSTKFVAFIRSAKTIRIQFKFLAVEGSSARGEQFATFTADLPLLIRPLQKGL